MVSEGAENNRLCASEIRLIITCTLSNASISGSVNRPLRAFVMLNLKPLSPTVRLFKNNDLERKISILKKTEVHRQVLPYHIVHFLCWLTMIC